MNFFSLLFCALVFFSAKISAVLRTNEDPKIQENDDSAVEQSEVNISLAEFTEEEIRILLGPNEPQTDNHYNTCSASTTKKFKAFPDEASENEAKFNSQLIEQHTKLLNLVKKFIPPPGYEKNRAYFHFSKVIFQLKEMQTNLQSIIKNAQGVNLPSVLIQQLQQELELNLELQKFIEQARLERLWPIDFLERIFSVRKVIKKGESLERWIKLRNYGNEVFKLKILFFEAGINLSTC